MATLAMIPAVAGCGSREREPVVQSPADLASASAVDLRVTGCRTEAVRGAGSMIMSSSGDRYVLTAAHVVAGGESIAVRATSDDTPVDAVLLAIDPANDIALLRADLAIDALPVGDMAAGDRGAVVVFRDDAPTVLEFTIVNPAIVNILDIYGDRTVGRHGYRVEVDIVAGDSGAVLIGPDGRADGVLYAKTRGTVRNAFATGRTAIDALLERAAATDPSVGVNAGVCP